jgi:hypothetical protein
MPSLGIAEAPHPEARPAWIPKQNLLCQVSGPRSMSYLASPSRGSLALLECLCCERGGPVTCRSDEGFTSGLAG